MSTDGLLSTSLCMVKSEASSLSTVSHRLPSEIVSGLLLYLLTESQRWTVSQLSWSQCLSLGLGFMNRSPYVEFKVKGLLQDRL